jgi:hypothetical protein
MADENVKSATSITTKSGIDGIAVLAIFIVLGLLWACQNAT